MATIIYHAARAVEKFSIRCGYGEFDLANDDWKCADCLNRSVLFEPASANLCSSCRAVWVHELGHIDYSDAFEWRVNVIVGCAGLLLGPSVWGANVRWGWWEQGAALAVITATLSAYLPSFLAISITWPAAAFFLVLTIVLSTFTIITCFTIVSFLLMSSPTNKRHWRHMTPPMYALVAASLMVYILFICWGVTVKEIAFVLAPMIIGNVALLEAAFMQKQTVDLECGLRLGDTEGKDGEAGKTGEPEREM